jgi:hypothetical protein
MTALINYSEKLSVSEFPGAWLVGLLYRVQADWGVEWGSRLNWFLWMVWCQFLSSATCSQLAPCLFTSVMTNQCTEQWQQHISAITVWETWFVNVKMNCVMYKYILDIFHKVHFYRHYYHEESIITSTLHLAQCYLGRNMQSFMAAYCLHLTMIFQGFSYFKGFKCTLFTGG